MTDAALPAGVATGIGSLPGDDIDAAVAAVAEALPDLPHLPELPARGPGADLVGRAAGVLVDLSVDLQPSGWRLVSRPGVDVRRSRDLLARDLDALVPALPGYDGPFKLQLAGPWTLAAALDLPRGDKAVSDAGAVRDLVASLAEGAREHVAEVRRRLPAAQLVLQLDEPSLPAVLSGEVRSASGLAGLRAVDATVAADLLGQVVGATGLPVVVHCCAGRPPLPLLARAGVAGVSFDASVDVDRDRAAELVEAGIALWLGVVPSLGPGAPPTTRQVADPVRRWWRELGFSPEQLPESVVVTPTCGLAGASPGWASTAMRLVQQAARVLREAPEGVSG